MVPFNMNNTLENSTILASMCMNGTTVTDCSTNVSDSETDVRQGFAFDKDILLAYNLYLYITIILGVPGNLIVLIVFVKHPPTTSTDWFIVFITVCDFVTSSVHVPIYVTFSNGIWAVYGTDLICKLHMFFSQSIVLSSTFLICGLALDRYFKICRPNSRAFTKLRAKNYCILISLAMTVLSIPCFLMYENVNGRCITRATQTNVFAYYLMVLVSFLAATTTFVVSYINITRAIIKSENNIRRHNEAGDKSTRRCWRYFCCGAWLCKTSFRRNRIDPVFTSTISGSVQQQTTSLSYENTPATIINTPSQVSQKEEKKVLRPLFSNKWVNEILDSNSTSSNYIESSQPTRPSQTLNVPVKKKPIAIEDKRMISLRTTKIAFLVCTIFVVSWIPPWVSFIIATSPKLLTKIRVIEFLMFGKMTHLLNTVANPILYTGLNRKFRDHTKSILFCNKL